MSIHRTGIKLLGAMAISAGLAVAAACGGDATPVPQAASAPTATAPSVSATATPTPTAAATPAPSPAATSGPVTEVTPVATTVEEGGKAITQYSAPPPMTIDPEKVYVATIMTNQGDMAIELFPKEAPITVNNFVFLARQGFYNGVVFHRIIADFMIQGGDPEGTGRGGPGYRFEDETVTRDYERGTLAMANAGPNTNGSQFFIIHKDYALPKNYNIFGRMTNGFEVLDAIATTAVGGAQRSDPLEPQVIQTIDIKEVPPAGGDY